MKFSLAPLQTFTDFHFRNALHQVWGSVDKYYAPYLKLTNQGDVKESTKKDILPENNPFFEVIPQILACGPGDFFIMEKYIQRLGYDQLNWNMGCPYPMVTNRKLGAGILNSPELLRLHLDDVFSKSKLKIGIKMRMGMESCEESFAIMEVLNDYPLSELIIHARFAKQLYNGVPDKNAFLKCQELSKFPIVFNGDILGEKEVEEMKQVSPNTEEIMIGRGAMKRPWIFQNLKEKGDEALLIKKLPEFTAHLFDSCQKSNGHKGYALQKSISYWEYLQDGVEDGNRLFRKLKKSKDDKEFLGHVNTWF